MKSLPPDFDKECADGLSREELSELVIGYAQENEYLQDEVERLTRMCNGLERSAHSRLQYIRSVRDAEAAIRRFVTDPAIVPYLPTKEELLDMIADALTPEVCHAQQD